MKAALILIFGLGFLAVISYGVKKNAESNFAPNVSGSESAENSSAKKDKMPVLVELYTSEGCSSCPPADRVLAQLEKEQPNPDAEIITLSLHVDYWNNLGWKDPFSSAIYSQRQTLYGQKFKNGSIYTPQMIVDGAKQFVGSNFDEAQKNISESAKSPKAKIALSEAAGALKIDVSDAPSHDDATVFLAIAEDNLTTKVGGGENGGRTLEHASVVRQLNPLGRILPTENSFAAETALQIQPEWKKENLKYVVFVQDNQSRKILGANFLKAQ